jgi:hypothetical protein
MFESIAVRWPTSARRITIQGTDHFHGAFLRTLIAEFCQKEAAKNHARPSIGKP